MAIEFPNISRRFDNTRRCVRFSGYDGAMEKSFFIEEEAIWHLHSDSKQGEKVLLDAFDRHRDHICTVAAKVYAKRREGSYTLTVADFS